MYFSYVGPIITQLILSMFISYFQQEGLVEIKEEYVEENSSEREPESGRLLYLFPPFVGVLSFA